MQCRSCGQEVGDDDRFCNACGARVGTGSTTDAPASTPLTPPGPGTPAAPSAPETGTPADTQDVTGGGDTGVTAHSGDSGVTDDADVTDDDRDRTGEMPIPSLYDFADEPDPEVTKELAAMASGEPVHDDSTTVLPATPGEPPANDADHAAPTTAIPSPPAGSDPAAPTTAVPTSAPADTDPAAPTTAIPTSRGASDPGAPTTAIPATGGRDEATTALPTSAGTTTAETTAVIPSTRLQTTGQVPATYQPIAGPASYADSDGEGDDRGRRFRFRLVLITAILAGVAGGVAASSTVIDIATDAASLQFVTGTWKVNDFGTNSTVAMVVAVAVMVIGGIFSCFGYRWGGGLAGGAGLALAGWSALVIGLAEVPLAQVDTAIANATEEFRVEMTRDIGYVAVAAAGALGVLTFLLSLGSVRRDRATSLNPWVAALGAAATLVAAVGPLLPEKAGALENNWSSINGPIDFPTLFFAGRFAQLGLLGFTGLVGFLLVRRYGLGLAAGGFTVFGWYAVTALLEQTPAPIGPADGNPGSFDTIDPTDVVPHAMTIGGLAVALFCLVMAGFEVALAGPPSDD